MNYPDQVNFGLQIKAMKTGRFDATLRAVLRVGPDRLFQALDSCWRLPESGDLWCKLRR